MKKNVKLIPIMIIALLLLTISSVFAADKTLVLETDSDKISQGEETPIVLSIDESNQKELGVISGTIKLSENLELTKYEGLNGWKITFNSQTGEFKALKEEGAKSDEVLSIIVKTKQTAQAGSTESVTIENLNVTTTEYEKTEQETLKSNFTVEASRGPDEIVMTELEVITPPTKTKYNAGEKFDPTGMVVIVRYSDGTSKVISEYSILPTAELTANDSKVTISYTEDGDTKTVDYKITVASGAKDAPGEDNSKGGTTGGDNTTGGSSTTDTKTDNSKANKAITNAGLQNIIVPALVVIIIVSAIGYTQYKKYKNI